MGTSRRSQFLSDDLETLLAESAIPEEYTMHHPMSLSGLGFNNDQSGGQGQLYNDQLGSNLRYSYRDIGAAPSSPLLGSTATSAPLTTPHGRINLAGLPHRTRSSRVPMFTFSNESGSNQAARTNVSHLTSLPTISAPTSPVQTYLNTQQRSTSQICLSARATTPLRPQTPTPSSAGLTLGVGPSPRSVSLPSIPRRGGNAVHPQGKPSVKHLTCYWWKTRGSCRFAEKDCLYAHRNTGLYADAPRQLAPGEPAKAGRALEKAMKAALPSGSPNMPGVAHASSPDLQINAAPNSLNGDTDAQDKIIALRSDIGFMREVVERNQKETEVLIHTIHGLQQENYSLKKDVEHLKQELYDCGTYKPANGASAREESRRDTQ